jgi:hypothetical protein
MVALSKPARAVSISVLVTAALVAAWIVIAQALSGRWSLHTSIDVGALFIVPLVVAVLVFCLPGFVLLTRLGNAWQNRTAAVLAGAVFSSVPAIIMLGLFMSGDSDSPQTIAESTEYLPLVLPFAIPGAVFGLVWSAPTTHSSG